MAWTAGCESRPRDRNRHLNKGYIVILAVDVVVVLVVVVVVVAGVAVVEAAVVAETQGGTGGSREPPVPLQCVPTV